MPSIGKIIGIIVGFVVVAIATPVGMNYLAAVNTTFNATNTTAASNYTAVFTIFSVLLPVLYMIGAGLMFIPRGGKK